MPQLIPNPAVVEAAGNQPKRIEEFVGRVRTGTTGVSVARMVSPPGWEEPPQTPEFDEVTLVLGGMLRVDGPDGSVDVHAGNAVLAFAGERVRYSTPASGGAEYVAVCVPAFSPALVHRHASLNPGEGEAVDRARAVRPTSTEAVVQNHLRAATVGVDAVMQDYSDRSVLITHDVTYRGLAGIRGFFDALFHELPAGFFAAVKMIRQEIVGEVAYILWERRPTISRATDTIVVRDGKILFQTFTAAL